MTFRRLFFSLSAIAFTVSACQSATIGSLEGPFTSYGTLSTQAVKAAEDAAKRAKAPQNTIDLPRLAWQDIINFSSDTGGSPSDVIGTPLGPIALTGSNRQGPPTTGTAMQSGRLAIVDVQETSTGLSVAGQDAPAMLVPVLDGSPITIRIKGSGLFRKHEERDRDEDGEIDGDDWEINALKRFTWTQVLGFIAHTYLDNKPAHRVLIDDSIALQPTTGGVFSDTELTMTLDPKGIPDYQIGGLHRLTVVLGKNWVRIPIRFGHGTEARSLAPQILSTRVLRTDDEQEKWLLEVIGRNLPISFLNTYATINGKRAYVHGAFATTGDSIGFVHIPKDVSIASGTGSLFMATPFGVTFGQF